MIQFKELYDYLMPQLPGITTPMLDLHIREVARDLCHKTHVWVADFDAVNTLADQVTYDLEPSEPNSEPVKIIRLEVNEVLMYDERYPRHGLIGNDHRSTQWPIAPKFTEPPFSVDATLTSITIDEAAKPTSAVTGGLVILGSMKPSYNASSLPDLFKGTYRQTLINGVLAQLCAMTRKTWTDASTASMKASQYQSDLNFAATQAKQGHTRGPLRVRSWG